MSSQRRNKGRREMAGVIDARPRRIEQILKIKNIFISFVSPAAI